MMRQSVTEVEFYLRGTSTVLARVSTSHAVPRQGEPVNINKKQYVVGLVQWAVDQTTTFSGLRACVELEPVTPKDQPHE